MRVQVTDHVLLADIRWATAESVLDKADRRKLAQVEELLGQRRFARRIAEPERRQLAQLGYTDIGPVCSVRFSSDGHRCRVFTVAAR